MSSNLYKFIDVEKDGSQLLRRQKSGDEHRPVELLDDDPEVPSVLDLGLHDLGDDLLTLGPPLGALLADHGSKSVGAEIK